MMSCTKLTSTGIQRLMLSGEWDQWLRDISFEDLESHIAEYRAERIDYESLQRKIRYYEPKWYERTAEKMVEIDICRQANIEKIGPPPPGCLDPYELERDFVEGRGSLIYDMFKLRRRIDQVEQEIFKWITKQHSLLLRVKKNSVCRQEDPTVREELENHSKTAHDLTTERDNKKAQVMCILLEIEEKGREDYDLIAEAYGVTGSES